MKRNRFLAGLTATLFALVMIFAALNSRMPAQLIDYIPMGSLIIGLSYYIYRTVFQSLEERSNDEQL